MKKIIISLTLALLIILSLVSCGRNNDKNGDDSNMDKNDGMITDTGTDTNIIDRAESMVDGVESDVMGNR